MHTGDLSIAFISNFAIARAGEFFLKPPKKQSTLRNDNHTQDIEMPPTDEEVRAYLLEHADSKGIKIFEALSASGLRSIRYLQEIEGVKSILVNDVDPAAVTSIKRNIAVRCTTM